LRVLILGGAGMLGHKLWQAFRDRAETFVTLRRPLSSYAAHELFDAKRVIEGIDVAREKDMKFALDKSKAEVVINAVGVVKHRKEAHDPIRSITINSLLPHQLAAAVTARGARFIHLSTDCVFSGAKGNYSETDPADPQDLYGRSKLLGEVTGPGCLTIRTSMVGRELESKLGLLEWFLAQRGGSAKGYQKAIFTGLTTPVLATLIATIAEQHKNMEGLRHIAADAITKYDLLSLINATYGLKVKLEPDTSFVCDRSLNGTKFRDETGFRAPAWPEMIRALHDDPTPYDSWNPASR
jgi:dTDP-4-dehydrorhamnose reductase